MDFDALQGPQESVEKVLHDGDLEGFRDNERLKRI